VKVITAIGSPAVVLKNARDAGERRGKPRIRALCPAVVRGFDPVQGKVEEEAVLENLSATGLYLLLSRQVPQGSSMFVLFRLAQVFGEQKQAPRIAVHGTVVRTEPQPNGTFGVALKFRHYRFV
jgi:hypothetical protein